MKRFYEKYRKLILMILFTLFALFIWRIGTHIKAPFVNISKSVNTDENIFGFLDIFTGGALSQFSILALGISPYITASIIIQMLQMDIVPKFKEWADEGAAGKVKLNRWTRYLALFLAFVQALTLIVSFNSNYGTLYFEGFNAGPFTYLYMALVMTAGSAFVLWLADQITMTGIGNGSSMLISAGIIARLPSMFTTLGKKYLVTTADFVPGFKDILTFIFITLLFVGIVVAVIWMEGLQRKIPIQYSNRPAKAQLSGKQESNIPIKLNPGSVIPVVFAATLLSLPLTVINFTQGQTQNNVGNDWWHLVFSYQKPIGFVLYVILIFMFTFFYSFLQVNPDKISENLKKQNAYIPGVKPGEDTAIYVSKVLFRTTLLGATYLTLVAAIPIIVGNIFNLPSAVRIGGTSIMIVVGVAVNTAKQIKTQSQAKEYRGFLG